MSQKNNNIALAFIFLFLFFVLAENSFASVAELQWNPNSEPDLAGYKIYWGTSARTGTKPSDPGNGGYSTVVPAGNVNTYKINNLPNTGTVYFSITAYDNNSTPNESAFSVEVKKTPGDTNKSGRVDIFDYTQLKANFNQTNCGNVADINLDCIVNIFDYTALKANFGAQS
jgi:hypothetical protein